MQRVHVVCYGERLLWVTDTVQAQNSLCAGLSPAKTCMWCLPREFAVLRAARACVLSVQAATGWGQHTLCPVSAVDVGNLECSCTPVLSMGMLACFWMHRASSSSETLRLKSEGWDLALFATCKCDEKDFQGTFCWTCLENSLVCGLHVHQNQ